MTKFIRGLAASFGGVREEQGREAVGGPLARYIGATKEAWR